MAEAIPLIDVSPLRDAAADHRAVALAIGNACRRFGFFRVAGHGIPVAQLAELEQLSREFFAQPDEVKAQVARAQGGAGWRGWFPLHGESTSGHRDHKEGISFGAEQLPGGNQFPATPAGLRPAVLAWMEAMTKLGAVLLQATAVGLGLAVDWFEQVTAHPTVLFRIFQYPAGFEEGWGVAEHTDECLLTILATDRHAGLQVHAPSGWIGVPPDPEVFVVNVGEMLERTTDGFYRSVPHRVFNRTGQSRYSFPFFFDPCPLAVHPSRMSRGERDRLLSRPRDQHVVIRGVQL